MLWLRRALYIAAVVSVPLVLITANVRWAFGSMRLYEFGFARHQVTETTGLSTAQLKEAGRQVRDYWSSPDEWLDVRVTASGATFPLFDSREILHMRDVKALVALVSRVQIGAALYLLVYLLSGSAIQRMDFVPLRRRLALTGAAAAAGFVVTVGLISVVAFGPLFTLFHRLSFSNDLWQLDPATSYLVRMFPFGFWMETTLLLGLATLLEAGLLAAAVLAFRWWERRAAQSAAGHHA